MSRSISIPRGTIERVTAGASSEGRHALAGPVVPAMPNLHSHAFQRAIAGRTGRKSAAQDDSFWTWRQAMYSFLDQVDADSFEAIAAQAYVEMAKAGYTAVGEFHYVHHDAAGKPYARSCGTRLAHRVGRADGRAGAHVAAGLLRACGVRRHGQHGRTAPVRAHAVHLHASRRPVARTRGRRALRARHRAAQPACGDAGGTRAGGPPGGARRAHPHPRGRTDTRGRRLLRVEPDAAGGMAADAGQRRRPVVHRARHAHDRA